MAYYDMRNIVVPSDPLSGPLEGFGIWGKFPLTKMRDERWIRVQNYNVHPRRAQPRFVVRKRRVFFFPVIFASNNLGHVMFRYYSIRALMSRLGMQPDTIVVYVAVSSAALTFGPSNLYRAFYKAQHGPWASLLSSPRTSSTGNPHRDFDLCFADGATGFGGIAQFHLGDDPLMVASRIQSAAKMVSSLKRVRDASLSCMKLVQPERRPQEPLLVTIIQRRRRKVINDEELVRNYLRNASSLGGGDGDYVLDPTTRIPLRIVMVTLEYLTLRQQAELVRRTDVLIGTMGAGQCWMMFMRKHTTVIELHSSVVMHCTGVGINGNRMKCDYSKQSVAAELNHIGWPLNVRVPCRPLFCDGTLTQDTFNRLMAASLCTVGKAADDAVNLCQHILSKSSSL
jgi:hypothetical protein